VSKSRKAARVFLVERVAYTDCALDQMPEYMACASEDGESFVPVRAFPDRKSAEAYRAQLEAEARAELSPALFCSYNAPKGLAARLRAFKFDAPTFRKGGDNGEQFRKWWAAHATDLTAEQRAAIWELFTDVSFYRVSETTLAN
jgi:hypothetical protein